MLLIRQLEEAMRRIWPLFLMVLSTAAVSTAQDSAAGAKVFADQKCSLCHSIGGKGNTKGPLDDVGSKLSAADIRAWVEDAAGMTTKTSATRKPAMKSYSLPKSDVDNLVAYLSTLKK
jgi:mono/diheme cytochrome c family protein